MSSYTQLGCLLSSTVKGHIRKVLCMLHIAPSLFNQIKSVVFDKTGTLTHGKPEVTHVMLFVAERMCPHQLFTAIVGLAESNSEHPLGLAITEFAKKV